MKEIIELFRQDIKKAKVKKLPDDKLYTLLKKAVKEKDKEARKEVIKAILPVIISKCKKYFPEDYIIENIDFINEVIVNILERGFDKFDFDRMEKNRCALFFKYINFYVLLSYANLKKKYLGSRDISFKEFYNWKGLEEKDNLNDFYNTLFIERNENTTKFYGKEGHYFGSLKLNDECEVDYEEDNIKKDLELFNIFIGNDNIKEDDFSYCQEDKNIEKNYIYEEFKNNWIKFASQNLNLIEQLIMYCAGENLNYYPYLPLTLIEKYSLISFSKKQKILNKLQKKKIKFKKEYGYA